MKKTEKISSPTLSFPDDAILEKFEEPEVDYSRVYKAMRVFIPNQIKYNISKAEIYKLTSQVIAEYSAASVEESFHSYSDIKRDVYKIHNHLFKAMKLIQNNNEKIDRAIGYFIMRNNLNSSPNSEDFKIFKEHAERIIFVTKILSDMNFSKRRKMRISVVCKRIIVFLEVHTGEKFVRNFDAPPEKDRSKTRFSSPGARFIQEVLLAIEPQLTVGQITDAVRQALSETDVGSQQKPAAIASKSALAKAKRS